MEIMIASPTAASAAATTITKNTNTWPSRASLIPWSLQYRAKATKLRFTALSISSTDMKMVMMLRLSRKPSTPSENRIALKIRYQESGTISALPLSEHHRAHDGDQNQHRGDLKRQQKILEQQMRDGLGVAEVRGADADFAEFVTLAHHDPAHHAGQHQDSGNAHQQGDAAAPRPLFHPGVQQHDDEHEQHHDGPGVNDHLDSRDKLGAQKQVDQRQRRHHHHQRECAVDRVTLRQQVDGPCHANHSEDDEQYLVNHLRSPGHDEAGDDDIGDGQRQQKLPSESHQLVIAETRQRAADPYVQKDEEENLHREPKHRQQHLQDWR